jgi:hypothetical protein
VPDRRLFEDSPQQPTDLARRTAESIRMVLDSLASFAEVQSAFHARNDRGCHIMSTAAGANELLNQSAPACIAAHPRVWSPAEPGHFGHARDYPSRISPHSRLSNGAVQFAAIQCEYPDLVPSYVGARQCIAQHDDVNWISELLWRRTSHVACLLRHVLGFDRSQV